MRTQKQIAASRENGRKSHGAATPDGMARIVNANFQSGIFAETQALRWEQPDELQELKDEYYARHPPASPEARCFTASPRDSDACACALQQGDRTFTRLQIRINSTRRAFHTALEELARLEARDRGAAMVTPASVSPVTQTPETQLQVLGSLRKNDSVDPAAWRNAPTPVLQHISFSESVFGICGPAAAVRNTQGAQ